MTRLLAAALLMFPALAGAETYTVDPSTTVGFSIVHWRLSTVPGTFGNVTGTVDWDPDKPEATTAKVEIPIVSVDTKNAQRDDHLRNAEILAMSQFPTATFESTGVSNVTDTGFDLVGTLTLKGVESEVTLSVTEMSAGGAKATGTLDRFVWGVMYGNQLKAAETFAVSQEVKLDINLVLGSRATPAG